LGKEMSRRKVILGVLATVAVVVGAASIFGGAAARDNGRGTMYEVTITNLTRGQIFSPALVATHHSRFDGLFELGSPASDELAQIAEDAVSGPLEALLMADDEVHDVQTLTGVNGVILPGETATVVVESASRARNILLVGMLVTTNDGFYAINNAPIPLFPNQAFYLSAYDAGSEANNEDCAFIPGPPCGNPMVRDTAGAEGYVHVHAGVHGGADLDPAQHDWRNPVAKVTIRRTK